MGERDRTLLLSWFWISTSTHSVTFLIPGKFKWPIRTCHRYALLQFTPLEFKWTISLLVFMIKTSLINVAVQLLLLNMALYPQHTFGLNERRFAARSVTKKIFLIFILILCHIFFDSSWKPAAKLKLPFFVLVFFCCLQNLTKRSFLLQF